MLRNALARLLVFGLLAAGLSGAGILSYAETTASDVELSGIRIDGAKLDLALSNLNQFRDEMRETISEICDEEISLTQAIGQIEESSRRHHPEFVRQLVVLKKPAGVREAIADYVINCCLAEMDRDQDSIQLAQVTVRLKEEQARLFSEQPRKTNGAPRSPS